jgi:hypothetical protein
LDRRRIGGIELKEDRTEEEERRGIDEEKSIDQRKNGRV